VLNEHPEAEERWAVITEAFDALSDPEQKRLYDMHSV
jgi:DnaJ-class molecular chaperone